MEEWSGEVEEWRRSGGGVEWRGRGVEEEWSGEVEEWRSGGGVEEWRSGGAMGKGLRGGGLRGRGVRDGEVRGDPVTMKICEWTISRSTCI